MLLLFGGVLAGLLASLLVERVVHAMCVLIWHVVFASETDFKTYSAYSVVGASFQGACNTLLAVGALTTTALGAVVSVGRVIVQITFLGLLFTFVYEYYPQFVEDLIKFYNVGFGAGLRAVLFETARVVYLFTSALLPLWNGLAYIVMKLITTVLLSVLNFKPELVLSFLGAFRDLLTHVVMSFSAYLTTFQACAPEAASALVDTACFEPGLRMLDVLTPMTDLRNMVGFAVQMMAVNCGILALPSDLLLYPLMDINFAKAVHNLVNSVLLGVLQIPAITYERCRYSESSNSNLRVLMCVPDFEPMWKTFASGIRFLGRGLDNWLNMAAVILEEAITGRSPSCAASPVARDISVPDGELFGERETIVVGLTPGMYAQTDGWSTEYTVFWSVVQKMVVSRSWPLQVDVGLGVAAVRYGTGDEVDDGGHSTTSMLGCRCEDVADSGGPAGTSSRLSITCAFSPFNPEAYDTMHIRQDSYIMPVEFQVPDTAYYMTCAQAEISVQSVRWPLTRVSRPDFNGVLRDARNPILEGGEEGPIEEPRELDAVVYVTPRCGFSTDSEDVDVVCIGTFTDAGCYPYCLAGRVSGSMNSVLTLYDSDDWESHVQLLQRDCGLRTITVTEDFKLEGFEYVRGTVPGDYHARFDQTWNEVGGTTYTTGEVPSDPSVTGACEYNANVATRYPRESLPTYNNGGAVRLGEQPFIVAGDASLFLEWDDLGNADPFDDRAFIRVKRLVGSEVNQFTLWTMSTRIATLGTCSREDECNEMGASPSLIAVPRAFSRSPGNAAPAAATKWSVLFAVNPVPEVYESFFVYCSGGFSGTQFQVTSAYGPIRIWRVDAFTDDGSLAAQVARDDVHLTIDAFGGNITWDACSQPRNLSVTSLTYLNEYNVAVTLLRASPRYYDMRTKGFRAETPAGADEVSYDVYYLNPRTMRLRRDRLWTEEVPVSTLAQGYLCAAVRRMPAFGGFFAEASVAASALLRFPMTLIVNIPALFPSNLRYIRECPVITRGHTTLRECGTNIMSLAYYWEAIIRGNAYFWRSFSDIGEIFSGSQDFALARTMLNGVSVAGSNGYNIMPKLALVSKPARMVMNRMRAVLRPFNVIINAGMGFTRFMYEFFQTLVVNFLSVQDYGDFSGVMSMVWNTLYDMRLRYEEVVTAPALQTCSGVGMMLGWSNPFASLVRRVCISQVLVVPTFLDVADIFFVHYPLLGCMCDMPPGAFMQREAAGKCLEMAPLQYKPVIASVIAEGGGQFKGMCISMTTYVNDKLLHVFDPLFSLSYDMAEDLATTIDYLLVMVGDGDAGDECFNFYSNPYIMVLMPYPLDYFRVCGETQSCRTRCADLFEAFETSRANTQLTNRETTVSRTMEKPFLTEDDVLNGRSRQPFQVLGMIEHDTCLVICGDASGVRARCFSVAGIDAFERVAVALYCLPRTEGTGMRQVHVWSAAGSESWSQRVLDLKFLHEREPRSLEGGFDALLAIRSDGLFLYGEEGVLQKVVGVASETFYTWSADAMHYIDHIFVVPGFAGMPNAMVVVHGSVRYKVFDEETQNRETCVYFRVDLDTLDAARGVFFVPRCDAGTNLVSEVGDSQMVFAPHPDPGENVRLVVLVPTVSWELLRICRFDTDVPAVVQPCVVLDKENGMLYSAATMLSSFRTSVASMFSLSEEGVSSRREDVLSQSSVESYDLLNSDGLSVVAFLKTDHAASVGSWLSDVRLLMPPDVSSLAELQEWSSLSMQVSATIRTKCSVMSCSGCLSMTTQKLCYAAQQCAVARCVGSMIHLQRPACMWGSLLKDSYERNIVMSQAVWVSVYEILELVVDLSTGMVSSNVAINFPYDAADMVVCETKDLIVAVFGSLLSVTNAVALTLTNTMADSLYAKANQIKALSTLITASLTNLFAHIAYGILYSYFALYQSISCSTNSFLAIFDVTGVSIRILPSGSTEGWDKVGGQCISKLAEESLMEFGAGTGGTNNVFALLDDMMSTVLKLKYTLPRELMVHNLDAAITWVVGMVKALQDLLQVADVRNCRVPDISMKLVGTCACGDTPAQVPPSTAGEDLMSSAFWCTGTLNMVLSDGSPRMIFNPYTLADLKAIARPTIDAYLDCISGGLENGRYDSCHDLEPRDTLGYLDRQGVTVLMVLARCRGNFVNRQWDEGAAVLFNLDVSPELSMKPLRQQIEYLFPADSYPIPEVRECLLQTLRAGTGNDACRDIFLQNTARMKLSEYFAYQSLPAAATYSVAEIDSCEVFTGPAADGIQVFEDCLDTGVIMLSQALGLQVNQGTACMLPYLLWSGRSRNRVPVASPHYKYNTEEDAERFTVAETEIQKAQVEAFALIRQHLNSWSGDDIEVSLFTTEGDLLHQAMDCMVLGPYAAVDLWPGGGSYSDLPSARYSRRPDASDLSREFETPCSGEKLRGDHRLPFTCGSSARRAMMKYFLRDYLGSDMASGLKQTVLDEARAYFTHLQEHWADASNFGCPCADDETRRDVRCCSTTDTAGWKAFLEGQSARKEIPGSDLTVSLLDDMRDFLLGDFVRDTETVLTKHAVSTEDYVWTAQDMLLAADLGLFHVHQPVAFYDEREANYPFRDGTSLFDLCISHVSAVLFTMPVGSGTSVEYEPTRASVSGVLSSLEEYVRGVTTASRASSPLFWHHVLRHVPSDSMMCLDAVPPHVNAEHRPMPVHTLKEDPALHGRAHYETLLANLNDMRTRVRENAGTDSETVTAREFSDVFAFGGAYVNSFAALGKRCVCGWRDAGGCFLPPEVCENVPSSLALSVCVEGVEGRAHYDLATQVWEAHRAVEIADEALRSARRGPLECWDMRPSDAWGLLGRAEADTWVRGEEVVGATSVHELLTRGRSGMRLGNIMQVRAQWNQLLSPASRHKPLFHGTETGRTVAQSWCASSFAARVQTQDLLDRYVDELFPVSQGVRGSLGVEACTRYMIELARHNFMEVAGMDSAATQHDVVQVWQRRCRGQLNTVASCNTQGVFDVTPSDRQPAGCPFTVSDLHTDAAAYVTRSCLVYAARRFHDPCIREECTGRSYRLRDIRERHVVAVDVRELATHPVWGGGFHWPEEFGEHLTEANISALTASIRELLAHDETIVTPFSMNGSAALHAVFDAPARGLFNTNEHWPAAEGISKHSGATTHCDSVIDWWPESWEAPVGYHVTTPPYHDEAGYRVFDNAFAVRRSQNSFHIVYEHEYLRNDTLSSNHFGASGLCGTHSYGMPMRELNTVRVCTRTSKADSADPAVPLRAAFSGEADDWYEEACAATYDVPWDVDTGPVRARRTGLHARRWAGLVSNWDDLDNTHWPPPGRAPLPLVQGMRGRKGDVADVLGPSCFLPKHFVCASDADCAAHYLGTHSGSVMRCLQGACAVSSQSGRVLQCARHEDCAGQPDTLCSGFGMCVPPVVQFTNELDEEVEAQLFSTTCPASMREQSMKGASPWGVIPDILPGSGFCGYRSWWEMRDLLQRAECATEAEDNVCTIDASSSYVRHTDTSGNVHRGSFWDEHRLRVSSHVCDRDYMHVSGFRACTPPETVCRSKWGHGSACASAVANLTRTYTDDKELPLLFSPAYHTASHGFLGFTDSYDRSSPNHVLRSCADIPQCHMPSFTMSGYTVQQRQAIRADRLSEKWNSAWQYTIADVNDIGFDDYFSCGAFGLLLSEGDRCILDPAVAPLFYILCEPSAARVQASSCPWSFDAERDMQRFEKLCRTSDTKSQEVPLPYFQPEQSEDVARHLNWLLTDAIQLGFTTLTEYRRLSTCAATLWNGFKELPELRVPQTPVWVDEENEVTRRVVPQGLYFFDFLLPHTATEMPFAWWVKCTLLNSIRPRADSIVACPAWENRIADFDVVGRESVLQILRRLDGELTDEWWDDNIEGPEEKLRENADILQDMLVTARGYLVRHPGVSPALSPRCFSRKEFDMSRNSDLNWMKTLYDFYTSEEEGLISDDMVISMGETLLQQDLYMHEIWDTLETMWGTSTEETPWFEAFDGLAGLLVRPGYGIPVGEYPRFQQTEFATVQSSMIQEECNPVLEFANAAPEDVFCIYQYAEDPFMDGLVAEQNVRQEGAEFPFLLVRADKDPLNRMQYTRFPFNDKGTIEGTFYTNLCSLWEDDEPGSRPMSYIGVFPSDDEWNTGSLRRPILGGNTRRLTQFLTMNDMNDWDRATQEAIRYAENLQRQRQTEQASIDNYIIGFGPAALQAAGLQPGSDCFKYLYAQMVAYKLDVKTDTAYFNQLTCDIGLEAAREGKVRGYLFERDAYDPMGQACSLARDSVADTCDASKLLQYSIFTDTEYLYCEGEDFVGGDAEKIEEVVANPAGDVCWSQYTTCANGLLRKAQRLRIPPGFTYWLYHDANVDEIRPDSARLSYFSFQKAGGAETDRGTVSLPAGMPAWQFCPTREGERYHVPKSSDASSSAGGWVGTSDYTSALVVDTNVFLSYSGMDTFVDVSVPIWSMRLRLQDDMRCCVESETRSCRDICGADFMPVMVRESLYKCSACTKGNKVFCRGLHGCVHAPLQFLSEAEQKTLTDAGVPYETPMAYDDLVRAVHLLGREAVLRDKQFDGTMVVKPPRPSYYDATNVDTYAYFDSTVARGYINSISSGDSDVSGCANQNSDDVKAEYTVCGQDELLRQFARFVREEYTHDAFVRVPPNATSAWAVSAEQMLGENIFAYAATNRPLREKFTEWLLDLDRHCAEGRIYSAICQDPLDNAEPFTVLNPWVGGDFNPHEFCDTTRDPDDNQRTIDVYCNMQLCPEYYVAGSVEVDPFYEGIPPSCVSKQGGTPSRRSPVSSDPTNLCTKAPLSQQFCMHAQASLGGVVTSSGVAVDGAMLEDLYQDVSRGELQVLGGLLYSETGSARNGLYEGRTKQDLEYTGITPLGLHHLDIAGHHLHMYVDRTGTFRVRDLVLGNPLGAGAADFLEASMQKGTLAETGRSLQWLQTLENTMSLEQVRLSARVSPPAVQARALSWDCPFTRLHFWSGTEESFSAVTPDMNRARAMFGSLNGNMHTHPLQAPQTRHRNVVRYSTSNGRCFCVNPAECSLELSSDTTECSLLRTIQSQYDERWVPARRVGGTSCLDQLDWPYVGGTLRDGTPLPGDDYKANCSVFERLPAFEYRQKNVPFRAASEAPGTTSDDGGDCHMGRAATYFERGQLECQLYSKHETHFVLLCDDQKLYEVLREQSSAPEWVIEHAARTRRRCSAADDPPAFTTADGTPMPAASSFGLHARISAERFLASELHLELCAAGTFDCDARLAAESWTAGDFLQRLVHDPHSLFTGAPPTNYSGTPAQTLESDVPSDEALWEQDWVTCTRDETSGRLASCSGRIAREVWIDPGQRFGACTDAASQANDKQLALNLTLCDLDGQTAALCRQLAQIEYRVQEAHCIASGACMRELYFYHPATFSTTNEEFVRETVEEFYLGIDEGSCDEVQAEREAISRQAASLNKDCAAQWLNPVVVLLEGLRAILHSLLRISYYYAMLWLQLFRLLGAVNFSEVMSDLLWYLYQLITEAVELVKAVGQTVWRMVLESDPGKKFMKAVKDTCDVVIIVINFIQDTACTILHLFFTGIHSALKSLKKIPLLGGAIKQSLIDDVADIAADFATCIEQELTCDFTDDEGFIDEPTLPSATRCWSQYITSLGDAASLSCTAADTCVDGISDVPILCDACPATPPGVNEYGCDPIRKQCVCGVPQMERTPCTSHFECSIRTDATCTFIESDVTQTFGTTRCADCANTPLCIKTSSDKTGFCSCTLAKLEEESCDRDALGSQVYPSAQGLCLTAVASARAVLTETTTFQAEYSALLSIPCNMASISQTFCFRVQYNAFTTAYRVVVLDTLDTGTGTGPFRRLLGALEDDVTAMLHAEWRDSSGVCAQLVTMYLQTETPLGVLEEERLRHCLHWRRVAQDTIRRHNLTRVDSHFLLSAQDFALEIQKFPSLTELVARPLWALDALLHTPAVQPVLAFFSLFERWGTAYAMQWNTTHTPWAEFLFALYNKDINFELSSLERAFANVSNASVFVETWSPVHHVREHQMLFASTPLQPRWQAPNQQTAQTLRRGLLQWTEKLSDVQKYSLEVTFSGEPTQVISGELAKRWVTGPVTWPPDYSYWENPDTPCVPGLLAHDIIYDGLQAVVRAYTKTGPPAMVPAASFRESALAVPKVYSEATLPERNQFDTSKSGLLLEWMYKLRGALASLGFDDVWVYNVFAAVPGTVNDFFTCDIDKVMFCTKYRRTVWNSFWWIMLYASLGLFAVSFMDIPGRNVVLALILTPLVLFYATEFSIMCGPMIPTCVLDESIENLDRMLPTRWHWPNALQTYPGCISGDTSMRPANISETASCLVSCSVEPHSFTRTEAPIAWWLCDYDRATCLNFRDWLAEQQLAFTGPLQKYLTQKAEIVYNGDTDLIHAQRICGSLTLWYVTPWILVLVVLLYVATWSTVVPVVLAQSLIAVAVHAYQMSHVRTRPRNLVRNAYIRRAMRSRRT